MILRWNIWLLIILSLFFLPRQWKQFYVILQDQVLHFYKDQKTARAVSFLTQTSFLPRVYCVPCLLEVKHPSSPWNTSSWTRPISDVTLKLTKPLIGWENDRVFFLANHVARYKRRRVFQFVKSRGSRKALVKRNFSQLNTAVTPRMFFVEQENEAAHSMPTAESYVEVATDYTKRKNVFRFR